MAQTRAQIQKAYRERKKAGLCVLRPRIVADKGKMSDDLIDKGLIGEWDDANARAITLAVQFELQKLLGKKR